jgi:hypothetical protein
MSRAYFSLSERKWVKIKIYLERACNLVKFLEMGISQIHINGNITNTRQWGYHKYTSMEISQIHVNGNITNTRQ